MSLASWGDRQGSRHCRFQESVCASRIGGRRAGPWQGRAQEVDSSYARQRRNDIKAATDTSEAEGKMETRLSGVERIGQLWRRGRTWEGAVERRHGKSSRG